MSVKIKSTKAYLNLPCGHSQWFDKNADGTTGHCAQVHGYDRSCEFTFGGDIDDHGWVIPFGGLKEVKKFLEYYFDHVTVLGADDPRIDDIPEDMLSGDGLLGTLRVLPYGVSMEMSSMFVWEQVNAFVYQITSGRVYVERVHMREHERNSAYIEASELSAKTNAIMFLDEKSPLELRPRWSFVAPKEALDNLNQ